ncbi:MAG: ABC transporter permease [Bryobacteraceae bacterium]
MLKRRQLERDLEDELAYHLELRRANAPAQAPFGNVTSIQETCRELWTFSRLEDSWRQVCQAARVLRRSPGHTIAIVALLALGIGANAAMFSLVNAFFIRELPVREPNRLVALNPGWPTQLFDDFRRAQKSFSGVLGTGSLLGTVVTAETGEQLAGARGGIASGNYFDVLGVKASIGRVFTEEDDKLSHPQPVMVIGHSFWSRQFAGDPSVLGRKIFLSGSPFTIIGVTPEGFAGDLPGRGRDFWVPLNMQPVANPQGDLRRNPGFPWLSVMGRLAPGVSIEQAEAEVVYDRLRARQTVERRNRPSPIHLESASRGFDGFRRRLGTQIQILAATAVIVLLIVWVNVATLLLARGAARQRELAVRQALGCGRARLVRSLLLEGLLLAGAGGSIGLAVAPACARALLLMQPSFGRIDVDLAFDLRMFAFGVGISLLTAIAFSLLPAIRASSTAIEPALRSSSRSSTGPPSRQKTLRFLVAAQTALSVILVAVSFFFARSLFHLHAVDGGYDRQHIVSATINARLAGYQDDAAQWRLGQRLVERISAVPGVTSASVALCAVLMGCSRQSLVTMEGHEADSSDSRIWINPVSANYFETTGIPVVMGRGFGAQDRPGSPRVAVVTQALARFYFPGQDAVGKRFTERSAQGIPGDPIEIIGVIRDIKFVNPRDAPIRMAFLSLEQFPGPFSYLQVRTDGRPEALVSAVRQAILEVDSKLFVMGPEPLSATLEQILARDMLLSRASGLFGLVALVLACFGVYGVISYLVVARTAEFAIRLAIGAKPAQVLGHIVANALKTAIPGIVGGVAGAWAAGRFIESLLFGVTGHDPFIFMAVAAALLFTTILAAYVPALRASRIDPLVALRCD